MPFDPHITDAEIKAISDVTLPDLQPFVAVSTSVVDSLLADKGLSDSLLRNIGIYLSAHFAYLKEGQIKSEKIGDSSTTFNVESGKGFCSTTFGQMAVTLDTSKTLAKANDMNRDSVGRGSVFESY